mgnify:CR=1 FL=1
MRFTKVSLHSKEPVTSISSETTSPTKSSKEASGKPVTSGSLAFTVVPRINAVGRLGLSTRSLRLLLTEDEEFLDERVIQHEPLGFHDYNCLQMNAFAVVSDSGTLPEESSFFTSVGHPFPAVCIRTSTERPEALDKACFILAGIDERGLLNAVTTAVDMNENADVGIPVPDYKEENVSTKVVKIIQSYTGVVNKMVWRKDS